jgi:16S rRNA (adenine1518-N6/adenine1519-N6)-dimethyltransferase
MARPRQTQSYLRSLFAQRGVAPQHRFGQNFLIDLNIHDLIVKTADVGPDDVVLEVGPGAGAMTTLMAATGAVVVAVDIDPGMVALTAEATAGLPNVRVLLADALAGKNVLNPVVLDNVRSGLAASPSRRLKLVANLPYNVATPVISNLLVHPELCPAKIVATIQLELAERMRAAPATEHYGSLSVMVQALANFELVRVLKPAVFWPRPKVESAVVAITPDPSKRAAVADLPWFHRVVRQVFLHRRKNLRGVLFTLFKREAGWTKPDVDALLESIGLNGMIRAETLNVEEFHSLADALKNRLGLSGDPEHDLDATGDDSDD